MSDPTNYWSAAPGRRIVLLIFVAAVTVAVASGAAAAETPPDDEVIELDDSVSVWVESPYAMTEKHPDAVDDIDSPLAVAVPTRTVTATGDSGWRIAGETNAPAATALDDDSILRYEFGPARGADTEQFAGENVSVLVAKLDDPGDPAADGAAELAPGSAAELLIAPDRDERATFDTHFTADGSKEMRVLDDEGYVASYYGLDEGDDNSGVYVAYTVRTDAGEGVTTEGGELRIDGEITVLGVETSVVQDGESTAETSASHELGEAIEFDVGPTGEDVSHTVAVLDESAVADERLTFSSERAVGPALAPEAVAVENSSTVNGVADVEPASIYGAAVTESPAHQTSEVGILASYLAGASPDSDGPAGSITARRAVEDGTVSVATLDSWSPGEYTYFHVATEADGTTTTTSGTVVLTAHETNESGSPPDDSSTDPVPDDSSTGSASSSRRSSYNSLELSLSETDRGRHLHVEHAVENNVVEAAPNLDSQGTTVTGVAFEIVAPTGAFAVDLRPADPETINTTGLGATPLSAVAVETESLAAESHGPVTIQFSVDDGRLAAAGGEPSDVRLYQRTDGWRGYETESLGDGRYEATVPQLSTITVGVIQDASEVLTISDAELGATRIATNESVAVTATVSNPTAEDVGAEIELQVDGEVESTLIETVPAGERWEVQFNLTPSRPGNYTVSVAGEPAGELEVTDETRTETPGFDLLAGVAALAAMLVGLSRLGRQ